MSSGVYANQVKLNAIRLRQRRLAQLERIKHMNILMYSKANCPNCDAAAKLLESKNLRYVERNVDEPQWRELFTRQFPDVRQMPQIFIDGQRVGGLAGLQAALKQVGL